MIGIVVVLGIPTILTLLSIRQPRPLMPLEGNPSPFGYTWSLSIFVLPTLVLGTWLHRQKRFPIQRKAFWLTLGVLCPLWCLLDITLGLTFFTFPNKDAVSAHFWGWTFDRGWQREIPVEEVGFYLFGFTSQLLIYIWGDEYWFARYQMDGDTDLRNGVQVRWSFHPRALVWGAAWFVLAFLYKKFGPHEYREGFPGYMLFLLAACYLPTALLLRPVTPFLNWRSLGLVFFFILFISLFWEGAIAVPYQWWGYNPEQMMGIFIGGFSGLPLEQPILWVAASWSTVLMYQAAVLWVTSRQGNAALAPRLSRA